jgi:hypothetical protein
MSKYETKAILEGAKTFDVRQYLRDRQDKLYEMKREFSSPNRNGALTDKTESAFFSAKEKEIKDQQAMVEDWLKSMDLPGYIGEYQITLLVTEIK